jgi:hypothetical protein
LTQLRNGQWISLTAVTKVLVFGSPSPRVAVITGNTQLDVPCMSLAEAEAYRDELAILVNEEYRETSKRITSESRFDKRFDESL